MPPEPEAAELSEVIGLMEILGEYNFELYEKYVEEIAVIKTASGETRSLQLTALKATLLEHLTPLLAASSAKTNCRDYWITER